MDIFIGQEKPHMYHWPLNMYMSTLELIVHEHIIGSHMFRGPRIHYEFFPTQQRYFNSFFSSIITHCVSFNFVLFQVQEMTDDSLRLNWFDARDVCILLGGDLASFHGPGEESYLIDTYIPK